MNANEDFLEVSIISYILAAIMSHLGMSVLNDMPLHSVLSHDLWMEDDSERKSALTEIAGSIVDKHIDLATKFNSSSSNLDSEVEPESDDSSDGSVYKYTRESGTALSSF